MVDYSPETKNISLDPKECEWALFGFASGKLIRSPLRPVLLDAFKNFETSKNPRDLWEDERLVGQGERIIVPAEDGMAVALSDSMAIWRDKHTRPQMSYLENAAETPLKTLVVAEDELVLKSIKQLDEISRTLQP